MSDTFTAKVWVLGDDIDTDIIIPTEYLALKTVEDMKPYAFSPLRPQLAAQIQPGDIIVAGKNFGCGSSREQAPEIIKAIENPDLHDAVAEGDTVEVTVNEGILHNGTTYPIASLPQNLVEIIEAGGLVKAMRKRNGLE